MPGDRLEVSCKLDKTVPIAIGTRFAFREGNKTVAVGTIKAVHPDTEEDILLDQKKAMKSKGKASVKKLKKE